MSQLDQTHILTSTGKGSLRHVLPRCLLALMLAVPTAAHPISLPELLRMPLEQLLRLEISAPAAVPALLRSTLGEQGVRPSGRGT